MLTYNIPDAIYFPYPGVRIYSCVWCSSLAHGVFSNALSPLAYNSASAMSVYVNNHPRDCLYFYVRKSKSWRAGSAEITGQTASG